MTVRFVDWVRAPSLVDRVDFVSRRVFFVAIVLRRAHLVHRATQHYKIHKEGLLELMCTCTDLFSEAGVETKIHLKFRRFPLDGQDLASQRGLSTLGSLIQQQDMQ